MQINGFHAEDSAQKTTWPESLSIFLNGKPLEIERVCLVLFSFVLFLPFFNRVVSLQKRPVKTSGRQGVAYVGKDKPVNITADCKQGANMLLFVSKICVCVRGPAFCLLLSLAAFNSFALNTSLEFPIFRRYHPARDGSDHRHSGQGNYSGGGRQPGSLFASS